MGGRGLRARFIQWSELAETAQQDRLQGCSLTTFGAHRTDSARSNKAHNMTTSSGPKAQGKSIKRALLTGGLLQASGQKLGHNHRQVIQRQPQHKAYFHRHRLLINGQRVMRGMRPV